MSRGTQCRRLVSRGPASDDRGRPAQVRSEGRGRRSRILHRSPTPRLALLGMGLGSIGVVNLEAYTTYPCSQSSAVPPSPPPSSSPSNATLIGGPPNSTMVGDIATGNATPGGGLDGSMVVNLDPKAPSRLLNLDYFAGKYMIYIGEKELQSFANASSLIRLDWTPSRIAFKDQRTLVLEDVGSAHRRDGDVFAGLLSLPRCRHHRPLLLLRLAGCRLSLAPHSPST